MALIDKASLLFVPSVVAEGKAFNILPSGNRAPDSTDQNSGYDQTRADFDFDRGSNASATRIGSDGLIKKYRENLLLQSNQFDTTWVTYNANTPASGQIGYDETNNAWLLTKTGADGFVRQFISASGVFTFSIYAKAGSLNFCRVYMASSIASVAAYVDLTDGSIGTLLNSPIDVTTESVGNGWYRISITHNDSGMNNFRIYPADGDNDVSGTSGSIYIQSAQLEKSLVATDYLDSTSVTGKAGVLVDLPRINYDANGENGSLLLEPSRTNQISFSEYFGSSEWLKRTSDSTAVPAVTDNYAISPEGVKNAARVVVTKPGTDNDYAVINDNKIITKSVGDKMSGSVYLKATDASQVGKIVNVYAYDGLYLTIESHTLTADWVRVEAVHTASSSTGNTEMVTIGKARANSGGTTLANMATDFLVYGAQFENDSSYPSSYIPNHGESGGVTRAADDMPVLDINPLNVGTTASIYFEGTNYKVGAGNSRMWATFDNTLDNSERFLLFTGALTSSTFQINLQHKTGGVTKNIAISNLNRGEMFKCVAIFNGTALQLYVNGSLVGSETITAKDNFYYLDMTNVQGDLGLATKQFIVFDSALTQSEAEALTTL